MYAFSEEFQAICEAVRAVCDAKVALYAADVDENARNPEEAGVALLAADFHPPTYRRSTAARAPTPWPR